MSANQRHDQKHLKLIRKPDLGNSAFKTEIIYRLCKYLVEIYSRCTKYVSDSQPGGYPPIGRDGNTEGGDERKREDRGGLPWVCTYLYLGCTQRI